MELETGCDIELILRSLFGLNKSQIQLFSLIFTHHFACTHFLEFKTSLKNNAVQKNLIILLNYGLIEREAVTISEFKKLCVERENHEFQLPQEINTDRGYLYLYKSKPVDELVASFTLKLNEIEENIRVFKNG